MPPARAVAERAARPRFSMHFDKWAAHHEVSQRGFTAPFHHAVHILIYALHILMHHHVKAPKGLLSARLGIARR